MSAGASLILPKSIVRAVFVCALEEPPLASPVLDEPFPKPRRCGAERERTMPRLVRPSIDPRARLETDTSTHIFTVLYHASRRTGHGRRRPSAEETPRPSARENRSRPVTNHVHGSMLHASHRSASARTSRRRRERRRKFEEKNARARSAYIFPPRRRRESISQTAESFLDPCQGRIMMRRNENEKVFLTADRKAAVTKARPQEPMAFA